MNAPLALEQLRGTVGLWTATLDGVNVHDSAELARDVAALGFRALWIPEAWGREAFTNAAQLLAASDRLVVATGIANIWARDAVAASNAAKTLASASRDRFVLGLGVSHQPLVTRMRGHHYARPLAAMRDYLLAMNAAPMFAPEHEVRVPRVLAALGPKMLELARDLSDGALTYLVDVAHTRGARELLADKFLAVEQAVVLGETREEYFSRAHEHLNIYTGLDNYRQSWRRQGFSDEDFVRGGSPRLCEAMVLHGDVDVIKARVREHVDAGADHVCLQVLGATSNAPPRVAWQQLASLA